MSSLLRACKCNARVLRSVLAFLTVLMLIGGAATYAQARVSEPPSASDRLLITLRPDTDVASESALLARVGGRVVASVQAIRLRVVEVPAAQRDTLRQSFASAPEVAAVDFDHILSAVEVPNDPGFSNQWGMSKLLAPQAWDVTHGSPAVRVGIVDSGIADHPDLSGKVVAAVDFSGSTSGTQDVYGHGTHVSGIAAAITNNGVGVAGLGYNASLINAKALGDTGSGSESAVASAVTWSADQGAQVINLSLGAAMACDTTLQNAVTYAWGKGAVVVAAAGNDGAQELFAPADCTNVLAVAATDSNDTLAQFSNFGPSVQVAAPGVNIYSTLPTTSCQLCSGTTGYGYLNGTSMAAPHVSGLAALIWASTSGLQNSDVVSRIESTADRVAGSGSQFAYGRINASRAVGGVVPSPTPTATPTPTSTSTPTATATSIPTATPTPIAAQSQMAVAYQIDSAHDGSTQSASLVPPLSKQWSINLGGTISYPLIAQGKVFVTVQNTIPGPTNLYALDEVSGQTAWGPIAITSSYSWATAAYDNGRVFVVNSDGVLQAFDASSGSQPWNTQLLGQYMFNSPPTASQGIVFVGGTGNGGTLYAVNSATGALLWKSSVVNGDHSSPALSDSGVYVSYVCAYTFAFGRSTGTPLWTDSFGCSGGGGRTPAYYQQQVYVRDNTSSPPGYIMNAQTGAVQGRFTAGPIPAFAGSTGFFLNGASLQAINLVTGATAWTFGGDGTLSSAPLVVNHQVYEGGTSGNLYALDTTTGQQVWSTQVGAGIAAPDEHNLYLLTGLNAGEGLLVVPAGNLLVAYAGAPAPTATPTSTPTATPTSTPAATPTSTPTATPTSTPTPGVPAAPTNLTARATASGIALNWSATTTRGVTYNVYRGTGGAKTVIASNLPTTTFTDNIVVKGQTYYYQVSATNIAGESALSNQASAKAH